MMTAWIFTPRLLAAATVLYAVFFFIVYFRMEQMRAHSAEWIERRKKPSFELKRAGSLEKKDILPIFAITAIYAAIAFVNLGNTFSPQTFLRFEAGKDTAAEIELLSPSRITDIFYFTGLHHGRGNQAYKLELSSDGVVWTEQYRETTDSATGNVTRHGGMTQNHSETFRWRHANLLPDKPDDTRYIRISAVHTPLELGAVSITAEDGRGSYTLTAYDAVLNEAAQQLFVNPRLVPERYSILNSSHFDEIYHARTAYEHLRGIYPYETTHPPLGKLITSAGIGIFGMTPFGWRFMPTLFGVMMVPLLYILLKWMFGRVSVAVCGTLIFTFDFMHFVQTRISTIDVYCVFFILCMYLFIFRYISSPLDAPFWETARPLILTGLSFGIGAAAKWQSIHICRDGPAYSVFDIPLPPLQAQQAERKAVYAVFPRHCFGIAVFIHNHTRYRIYRLLYSLCASQRAGRRVFKRR
jgi:hypothetical protein